MTILERTTYILEGIIVEDDILFCWFRSDALPYIVDMKVFFYTDGYPKRGLFKSIDLINLLFKKDTDLKSSVF